jgi:peptidoglycan hydrolase FlgJ
MAAALGLGPSMALPASSPAALAADASALHTLRGRAAQDPRAAVRETAQQFEALFMQQLLKTMREANAGSGWLDNEGSKLGTELLDQQLATKMTGLPGGLGEAIQRQLERQLGLEPSVPATMAPPMSLPMPHLPMRPANPRPLPLEGQAAPERIPQAGPAAFLQQHRRAAEQAEAATGIPAPFMLAQAAHESGWGRREIRHADGTPAHNLFGIKAGPGWNGPVADVMTTEYINGQPRKMVQRFRAYASHAESFADYARLIGNSPRYREVMAAGSDAQGFAHGLQRAGYATDPAYAHKLTRVINTTLALQRAQP